MEGPVVGTIIFTKDGRTYEEIGNARFKYLKIKNGKEYDFKYPSEFEFVAEKGKQKLYLKLKMTTDTREYVARFPKGKYWLGFVICEAPGVIEGYYFDGSKKTKLKGICKIEPQRQISFLGHNSLKIDFLKPPKGIGLSFDLNSHYFKKKIGAQLNIAPKPKIKFKIKK
jgi:predicted ester cyclase